MGNFFCEWVFIGFLLIGVDSIKELDHNAYNIYNI